MLKSKFNRNEDKTNRATIESKSNFDLKLHSLRTERPRPIQTHLYMHREIHFVKWADSWCQMPTQTEQWTGDFDELHSIWCNYLGVDWLRNKFSFYRLAYGKMIEIFYSQLNGKLPTKEIASLVSGVVNLEAFCLAHGNFFGFFFSYESEEWRHFS